MSILPVAAKPEEMADAIEAEIAAILEAHWESPAGRKAAADFEQWRADKAGYAATTRGLRDFWAAAKPPQEPGLNGHKPDPAPQQEWPSIITAAALAAKDFAEPRYAVPGVVPEGASLLVGRPKQGKSWLLLGLGVAIAAEDRALGQIAVEPGDVSLLCLEDNQRRLQDRLWRILDGESAPARLHLVTEWPRLDEGGAEQLDAWLTAHPETRLVGIDVLARMRPSANGSGDLYKRDYDLMAAIKGVADAHGVPLMAVHHSRKMGADDPLDTISGTSGLAGAADTALILTRERGAMAANLNVRGRRCGRGRLSKRMRSWWPPVSTGCTPSTCWS
jgi:hypothetical protein